MENAFQKLTDLTRGSTPWAIRLPTTPAQYILYCIPYVYSVSWVFCSNVLRKKEKNDIIEMFVREHRKLRKKDRVFLIGAEQRLCIQISIQTRVSCYYTWSPWAQEQLIACWFNIYKHKNRSAVSSVITTSWSHSCWRLCYKWSNSTWYHPWC